MENVVKVSLLVILLVVSPFLALWIINTFLGLGIPYTFKSWVGCTLLSLLYSSGRVSGSKK